VTLVLHRSQASSGVHEQNGTLMWIADRAHGCLHSGEHVSELHGTTNIVLPVVRADIEFGVLTFAYRGVPPKCSRQLEALHCIAMSLGKLLELRTIDLQVTQLAMQAAQLEAHLADNKISDRINGCVDEARNADGAVDLIAAHIESVASGLAVRDHLRNRILQLEHELNRRAVLKQAKALLQQMAGVSEEQASCSLETRAEGRGVRFST
jgi:hypothetical protein